MLVEPVAQHVESITKWGMGGGPSCLRWSANGERLLFDLLNYDTTLDAHCICSLELGGETTRLVVGGLAGVAQPVIGQDVVFRGPATSRGHRLYAVRANLREEILPDVEAITSAVSRDGHTIAALCRARPERYPTGVTWLSERMPQNQPPRAPEMTVMIGPLAGPWTEAARAWYQPVPPEWSPDGRQLLVMQSAHRTAWGCDTSPSVAIITPASSTVETVPLDPQIAWDMTRVQWGRPGEILYVSKGTIYSFDLAKRVQRQVFPFPDVLPGKER
jgi:hypothetical protein